MFLKTRFSLALSLQFGGLKLTMSSILKLLNFYLVLIAVCDARTSDSLKVQLGDGSKIVGRYLTSLTGRGIRAFMGVPYAEPPIGDLRFKV